MAEVEKNHPPSVKKLREARRKGMTSFSQELFIASSLLGGISLLYLMGPLLKKRFENLFKAAFTGSVDLGFIVPFVILLILLFMIPIGSALFQRGWIWTTAPMMRGYQNLKLGKIRPLYIVGIILIKTTILIFLGMFFFKRESVLYFPLAASVVFFILAWIDLFYKRVQFAKEMAMSDQELQAEKRENDNNSLTKRPKG